MTEIRRELKAYLILIMYCMQMSIHVLLMQISHVSNEDCTDKNAGRLIRDHD